MKGSGGAIQIKGVANTIINGNEFANNSAKNGGAMSYECGYKDPETNSSLCKVRLTGENTFVKNTASERGGALNWLDPV